MVASHSVTVLDGWDTRRFTYKSEVFFSGNRQFDRPCTEYSRESSKLGRRRLEVGVADDLVGDPVRRAGLDPAQSLVLIDEARDDVGLSRRSEHVHAPALAWRRGPILN